MILGPDGISYLLQLTLPPFLIGKQINCNNHADEEIADAFDNGYRIGQQCRNQAAGAIYCFLHRIQN